MLEELDIGHKSLNVLDALSSLETAISNADDQAVRNIISRWVEPELDDVTVLDVVNR